MTTQDWLSLIVMTPQDWLSLAMFCALIWLVSVGVVIFPMWLWQWLTPRR
jgi:hypothetical protein